MYWSQSESEIFCCLLEGFPQFGARRIPMNSAVCFSSVLIITTYKSHFQFWNFGFKSMSFEMFVGKNVIPLPFFCIRNNFFWIIGVSSLLDCSIFVELSSLLQQIFRILLHFLKGAWIQMQISTRVDDDSGGMHRVKHNLIHRLLHLVRPLARDSTPGLLACANHAEFLV